MSESGMERVGCYILRRDDGEDRFFGSVYPALSEDWPTTEVTIAWWYTEPGTDREEGSQ